MRRFGFLLWSCGAAHLRPQVDSQTLLIKDTNVFTDMVEESQALFKQPLIPTKAS